MKNKTFFKECNCAHCQRKLDQIKSSSFVIKNYTNDLYKSKKYDTFKEITTKYELRFLSEGKKIKFLQCLR